MGLRRAELMLSLLSQWDDQRLSTELMGIGLVRISTGETGVYTVGVSGSLGSGAQKSRLQSVVAMLYKESQFSYL